MQIEPNGLMAGNPLTPLARRLTDRHTTWRHPFFRGNVMQNNGIDGLLVVTDRAYPSSTANNNYVHRTGEASSVDGYYVNQTVNAVWDLTDLTYVLRGDGHPRGAYDFGLRSDSI